MIVNGLSLCPSSTTAFTFGPDNAVQLTWLNAESTTMSVSGDAVFTVSAERVALLYRSSDLTAAGAAPSAGSNPASSGSGSSGSDSGLSTGAVAGIAIGAAVAGVAAVLASFWLCTRRRRRRDAATPHGDGADAAHPAPGAAAYPAIHVPTGAEHELKATQSVSARPLMPAAGHAAPGATELQGSTPPAAPAWPVGSAAAPGTGEVSAPHDYHQLPGTFERGQGVMDNSRQGTPVDLVGRGAGGRGFPPEKGGVW